MDIDKLKHSFIVAGYDFQKIEEHVINSVRNSMDEDGDPIKGVRVNASKLSIKSMKMLK